MHKNYNGLRGIIKMNLMKTYKMLLIIYLICQQKHRAVMVNISE